MWIIKYEVDKQHHAYSFGKSGLLTLKTLSSSSLFSTAQQNHLDQTGAVLIGDTCG